MYRYLQQLEAAAPVQPNYLTGCHINSKMRSVLVDWLVDVQQQFKLLQETLFLSVNIIDRYVWTGAVLRMEPKFCSFTWPLSAYIILIPEFKICT